MPTISDPKIHLNYEYAPGLQPEHLDVHPVLDVPIVPPYPEDVEIILFGLGCFWGAEKLFWSKAQTYVTAVGYAGGFTQNPNYREVCTGLTGHAEVVLVAYRADDCPLESLLKLFWENHDPTQGMRQGNDVGTQYRSTIFWTQEEQLELIRSSEQTYQQKLNENQLSRITTEIKKAESFCFAETYHQQYLYKNPHGYCNLHGTGVCLP